MNQRLKTILILAGLISFVILLSVFSLSHQSLRLDEAQSLWQTSHTPMKILQIVGQDVHVPLYHLILHFWQVVFGNAVNVGRVLSLIFFVLTIPAVYLLGKTSHDRTVGLFAATLVAVSPFMNWYGNEIRMYTLLTLLTVLNQYFFMRIFKQAKGAWSWIGYTLTAVLAAFTHYFFLFVLLTQAIFYLFNTRRFARRSLPKFITVGAVLTAALAPWAWFVYQLGSANNTRPLLSRPTSIDLFNTFSQFIFGFQSDHLNTFIVSLWPVTILLGAFALQKSKRIKTETIYFFLAATLPILAAFTLSSYVLPVYLTRYLIIALPALYLFLGAIFSTYQKNLATACRVLLIAGMLTTLGLEVVSNSSPVKENYAGAATYLNQQATPKDVIIVSAPFTIYPVEYYYSGPASISTLPLWDRYDVGVPVYDRDKLEEQVNTIKGSHQDVYVLLSYDQGYEKDIKDYFDSHYQQLEHKEFSPKLNLYKYKLRYD